MAAVLRQASNSAQVLFSAQYLYVFEATSVLILIAMVGAIILARRETH